MDYAELKRRVDAVLESSSTIDRKVFRWRIPSEGEVRRLRAASLDAHSFGRSVCAAALFDWSGVMVGDILPDDKSAEEPLEFDVSTAILLLDTRVDISDALSLAVLSAYKKRRDYMEEQAKKREPASVGS